MKIFKLIISKRLGAGRGKLEVVWVLINGKWFQFVILNEMEWREESQNITEILPSSEIEDSAESMIVPCVTFGCYFKNAKIQECHFIILREQRTESTGLILF